MLKLKIACVFAICVGLLVAAQAQSPPFPGTFPQGTFTNRAALDASSGFSPSCSQSSTFLAAAIGVTLTADKTNYDNLICGLNTDGEFSKLDVFYVWAAPSTTNAANINIANPGTFNGTVHGTPTSWTAYSGYVPDGSTFYIDSGFDPTVGTPNFSQNSASAGAYVQSTRSTSGNLASVGGDSNVVLEPWDFGALNFRVNFASFSSPSNPLTNVQAAYVISRTTSANECVYQNSGETPIGGSCLAATSIAPTSSTVFFFAWNLSGPLRFSTDAMAAGFIGGGLSAVDSCKVNNRINTYMAAYSNSIYTNSPC